MHHFFRIDIQISTSLRESRGIVSYFSRKAEKIAGNVVGEAFRNMKKNQETRQDAATGKSAGTGRGRRAEGGGRGAGKKDAGRRAGAGKAPPRRTRRSDARPAKSAGMRERDRRRRDREKDAGRLGERAGKRNGDGTRKDALPCGATPIRCGASPAPSQLRKGPERKNIRTGPGFTRGAGKSRDARRRRRLPSLFSQRN